MRLIASSTVGPNGMYRVAIHDVRPTSTGVQFKGSVASVGDPREFSIHLSQDDPLLDPNDHSRVLANFKRQVALRLLGKISYEEGDHNALHLGSNKIRLRG